ncbi:hypothetical protein BGX27_002563 [Mortierella sp. AM989]|nr:hypothetical protein BGX27_002563 [Mortierella sp. AM989]
MSAASSLLEVPEIVCMIGHALPRRVQASCLCLSKLWHNAIAPLVWQDIALDDDIFARRNERPPLEGSEELSNIDIKIWQAISDMSNLQELTLVYPVVDEITLPYFENICTRIKVLWLHSVHMVAPIALTITFPLLQDLLISMYSNIDAIAFASQCPTLEIFQFETNELEPCQRLAQLLNSGGLPRLRHLDLELGSLHSDKDMASFIQGMHGLRKFESAHTIGPLSLPGFRSHFSTITEITIGIHRGEAHGLWQEVMSSCPLLILAKTCQISKNEVFYGAPWICNWIKELRLNLRLGSDGPIDAVTGTERETMPYAVLKRISELKALEKLCIGGYWPGKTAELVPGEGLELLSSLRRLKVLTLLSDTWSVLHIETAEWIQDHLEALEVLSGSWTLGNQMTRNAVALLRRCGIDVHWEGETKFERN